MISMIWLLPALVFGYALGHSFCYKHHYLPAARELDAAGTVIIQAKSELESAKQALDEASPHLKELLAAYEGQIFRQVDNSPAFIEAQRKRNYEISAANEKRAEDEARLVEL